MSLVGTRPPTLDEWEKDWGFLVLRCWHLDFL